MPPIAKETEAPSAIPATTAARPPVTPARAEDTAARPQPVALEVPVIVNGARTVEGSDKREPFSESTRTVLVFGNGAVIRLSSAVAPGQLLFLTNDKTKKEVVCQVVKSKNYRNVSGYVELEFTEQIVGFWGVRFPNDRIGPASPAPALAGPKPVAPQPEPVKIQPPAILAPPAPQVQDTVVPKSTEPPAEKIAKPAIEEFAVSNETQAEVAAHSSHAKVEIRLESVEEVAAKTDSPMVPDSPRIDVAPIETVKTVNLGGSVLDLPRASDTKPVVASAKPQPLPDSVPLPATTLPPAAEVRANVQTVVPVSAKKEEPSTTRELSMEELKLETARLQEQLASLLFTGTQEKKPEAQVPSIPALDTAAVSDVSSKLLEFAKPGSSPVREEKPATIARPALQSSLDEEEIKIPAWLEPLVRNAAASSATQEVSVKNEMEDIKQAMEFKEQAEIPAPEEASATRPFSQVPMFGNQLLLDENKSGSEEASSGSKKGILIGAIAAGLLVLGVGGARYFSHSGNSAAATPAPQSAGSSPTPAQVSDIPVAQTVPANTKTSPAPAVTLPVASTQSAPASHDAAKPASNTNAQPEQVRAPQPAPAQPVPAQPKKPVMGDVHLAAPVVNRRGVAQDSSEVAPNLVAAQATTNADALGGGLIGGNTKQPTAPLPIGGDAKPATMIASVAPVYSAMARSQHISGDVKIDALIDETGRVFTMKIISGPTLLQQSAMDALRQWKYKPAMLNGQPVASHLTVTLQFRLQ